MAQPEFDESAALAEAMGNIPDDVRANMSEGFSVPDSVDEPDEPEEELNLGSDEEESEPEEQDYKALYEKQQSEYEKFKSETNSRWAQERQERKAVLDRVAQIAEMQQRSMQPKDEAPEMPDPSDDPVGYLDRSIDQKLNAFKDTDLARPLQGLGYRQYPRLREEVGSLAGQVGRSLNRPTDAQLQRHGELVTETDAAQAKLNAIVNGRIARLNALLKDLPHIIVPGGRIS